MPNTKIATCCYCGHRATLVLRGRERHELSCAKCGAPLHDLKMLPLAHHGKQNLVKPTPAKGYGRPETSDHDKRRTARPKYKKRKKRKSLGRWFVEEAWDVIEDVFD